MKPTLYMETSVVSYLNARPSKDIVLEARQLNTREWWQTKRRHFTIFVSRFVFDEASDGDAEMVRRRLSTIKSLPWLQMNRAVALLAKALVAHDALPLVAAQDAIHVALAAVHGIHFLATWNMKHINNPATAETMREVCHNAAFHCPVICTPEELLAV